MDNVVYTDGACSKNGSKNSSGGFGLFLQKSIFSTNEIKLNKKCQLKQIYIKNKSYDFPVTNIRMEGYAILTTLFLYSELIKNEKQILESTNLAEYLNNLKLQKLSLIKETYEINELKVTDALSLSVHIITDSEFWINVITKWMPGWIKKKILLTKKNPDILLYIYYYISYLRDNGIDIKFIHVKSHQIKNRTFHADGNDVADVLATSTKDNEDFKFKLV